MSDQYDAVQLATDATKFARSQFGKHYLAKLERRRAEWQNVIDDRNASDEDATRARWQRIALAEQIEFFRVSQQIKEDPSMLQRLREGAARRLGRKEATDEQV